MERASGKRQNATDTSVQFSESNYKIECDTLNPNYKPGLQVSGKVRLYFHFMNIPEVFLIISLCVER